MLVFVLAGNVYADEIERARHRIAVSGGLINAEISYEHLLSPSFSVMAHFSYNTWIIADALNFGGRARWYPFGGTFFLDLGLGYSYGRDIVAETAGLFLDIFLIAISLGLWTLSDNFQERWADVDDSRRHGFLVQPGMGWNIDLGRTGSGFMLPISMGLDMRFAQRNTVLPFFRMGLGYAF